MTTSIYEVMLYVKFLCNYFIVYLHVITSIVVIRKLIVALITLLQEEANPLQLVAGVKIKMAAFNQYVPVEKLKTLLANFPKVGFIAQQHTFRTCILLKMRSEV